jgi:hypothetical protein
MRDAASIIFCSPDVTRQKPCPENFRKKLYVRQNRRVLPPIADDRRALRLLMTGLKLVVG